jgi:hypothetical protein
MRPVRPTLGVKIMKKFKIAVSNMGGRNHLGSIAVKGEFISNGLIGGSDFIASKRADANQKAQDCADWASQFDDQIGTAFLVCRKTPRKGWVVVAQF